MATAKKKKAGVAESQDGDVQKAKPKASKPYPANRWVVSQPIYGL